MPDQRNSMIGTMESGISSEGEMSDRIYPVTRWVAILITPFLLGAWAILYFFPTRTAELFAWPINPPMTAMFLGAGFGTGAYFFIRAFRSGIWHPVAAGFLPVAFFAGIMALTTVLHWERFTHGHPAFITWVVVYALTPVLVPLVWFYNRRADSRQPLPADVTVPLMVRRIFGLAGVLIALVGLYFYINPQSMIAIWPWTLTPLTARASLGFILLSAGTEIMLSREVRWSGHRNVIAGQIVGLALIGLAVLRAWGDFTRTPPRPGYSSLSCWFFWWQIFSSTFRCRHEAYRLPARYNQDQFRLV
jgi:hypothetical protein